MRRRQVDGVIDTVQRETDSLVRRSAIQVVHQLDHGLACHSSPCVYMRLTATESEMPVKDHGRPVTAGYEKCGFTASWDAICRASLLTAVSSAHYVTALMSWNRR